MIETLPSGYEFQPSIDGRLLFIRKLGVVLRKPVRNGQRTGGPVWFYAVDREAALAYVQEHAKIVPSL